MHFTILENRPRRVITCLSVALLAALPLIVLQQFGDPFQAPRVCAASLAIALLVIPRLEDVGPVRSRHVTVAAGLIAAFAIWYVVSALASHPASSLWGVQGRFQGLVSFALLVAASIAGHAALRGREALAFAACFATSAVVVALLVLGQAMTGSIPQGTFGNPTVAGAWLALGTALSAGAGLALPHGRPRHLLLGSAALILLATAATGSRGALVAAVAGLACVWLAADRANARRSWVIVCLVVLMTVTGAALSERGLAHFSPGDLRDGSAHSRLEIWRGTVALIGDEPLLGVGPGRFLYEFPRYQPVAHAVSEGPDVRPDQAHSHLLHYSAESGLPAGVMWLALASIAVFSAWRGMRRGNAAALIALGGIVAYVTGSVFGVAAAETDVAGWLIGGMAVSSASVLGPTRGPAQKRRVAKATAAAMTLSLAVAALSGWYLVANWHFGRGLDRFNAGDLAISAAELDRAIALDPFTDIYRVAAADTATYATPAERQRALATLDRGLRLEPGSYDLALSRARTLRLLGRPPAEVADAYSLVLETYPLGMTARQEAVAALTSAGRAADARREGILLGTLRPGSVAR